MITLTLTFGALNFHPLVFLGEETLVPPDSGGQPSQVGPREGLAPHHGWLAVGEEDQPPPAGQAQPPQWAHCSHTGTTLVWKYLLGRRVACCPVRRGQVLGTGSTFQQFNLLAHPDVFLQQIAWSRVSQWNAHTPIICFGSKWTFLSGWFGILKSNSFLNVQPDFLRDMVQVT